MACSISKTQCSSLCIGYISVFLILGFSTSQAMFLPAKDVERMFSNWPLFTNWPGQRVTKELDIENVANAAQQLREPLSGARPGQSTSVLGTVLAKWLIAEYNKEAVAENTLYKLMSVPSSKCNIMDEGQCQVQMEVGKVVCNRRQGMRDCVPQAMEIENCVATFDLQTFTAVEPVICEDVMEPQQIYSKTWGPGHGNIHPVMQ